MKAPDTAITEALVKGGLAPFCQDRCEVMSDMPATLAIERIERIREHLHEERLNVFRINEEDIARFEPRNDFNIRIDYENLRRKFNELKSDFDTLSSKCRDWGTRSRSIGDVNVSILPKDKKIQLEALRKELMSLFNGDAEVSNK